MFVYMRGVISIMAKGAWEVAWAKDYLIKKDGHIT